VAGGQWAGIIRPLALTQSATMGDINRVHEIARSGGLALDTLSQMKQAKEKKMVRRMVQVFVADADESVPLETCLLYSGEAKMTDLNDQELFFELDIKTLLAEHNAKRVKLVNKKVKERTQYLEPARVRDLKMTVVTIATF
jgi:hypothetical protein